MDTNGRRGLVDISRGAKYIVAAGCVLLSAYLCLFPREMILSVKEALILWYSSVLPSVFPFLIITKILIEIGALYKIGRLLEPVMRPVFGVPGCGAFALVMGGVSGYPVGAGIAADLRESGALSKDEAQRLLSFCNSPSPLFMLGAVGTSILGSVAAGYLIMASNYLSALILGIAFRFYKSGGEEREYAPKYRAGHKKKGGVKPLGRVLGDSVMYAVEVVVQIGGFILLFGSLISLMKLTGALEIIAKPVSAIFPWLDSRLAEPLAIGIVEITNGIRAIGVSGAAFFQQSMLAGALVSFGGLSIYAQTVSLISKTDLSAKIYLFAKMLHGLLGGIILLLLYPAFMGR